MSQTHKNQTQLPHPQTQLVLPLTYADITSILMATKIEDPSASTSTPIVEGNSSDHENEASQTEPVPPMPPLGLITPQNHF